VEKLRRLFHLKSKELNSIDFRVKTNFDKNRKMLLKSEITSFGDIEFENVTFAYENRPDKTILKKFSLKIEPVK
jgi:ABC-type multidrug transport system fused ATPase/permease subunit